MDIFNMILLYLGKKNNCINDIINLIAILENCENDINIYFDNKDDDYDNLYFKPYIIKNSDHLTILNIYYNLYLVNNFKFLNKKIWDKINDHINIIKDNIINLKIKYDENELNNNKYEDIRNIILEAYKYNKLIYDEKENYKTINNIKNKVLDINKVIFMKYGKNDGIYTKIINRFGKITFNCVTLEL